MAVNGSVTQTFKILFLFATVLYVNALINAKNCEDIHHYGFKESGIYEIQLNYRPVLVYCNNVDDGGGWTVIQQRMNGQVPFWNAGWDEYARGFGQLGENTEFWAGNELIYHLTNQCRNMSRLRVTLYGDRTPMSQDDGQFYVSDYLFRIDPADNLYTIHVQYDKNLKGNASTGWYDITSANMNPFSTVDRIHDPESKCIRKYRLGGWWTKNCGVTSLNGDYNPKEYGNGYGMFFMLLGQHVIHPRMTRMMIRCNQ
ncbi:unnamed protein product [Bursaphelenchus okinawaensis]|uniref:Fibrinogen C-terminal domain-containing protein n=1 Tax=Bursaphelenchus okinawaensis TaxID=465554 RepID=A0A811JQQ1_9BILA|nr:unnamed protein product [Bursaphelenchus okinawaensis]CAG9078875.1 unnamed protein product [Bursaphelenchus okinawaensis]